MAFRILVVDDEESIRFTFAEFLGEAGYQVDVAATRNHALQMIEATCYDVLFLDIFLGRESGMAVLEASKRLNPNCPVIMVTGSPEIDTAAQSVRLAAYDYLIKPVSQQELVRQARRAIGYKQAVDEKQRYQQQLSAIFDGVREGILVFDPQLRLTEMNYAATQILECDRDIVGRDLAELIEQGEPKVLKTLEELLHSRVAGELYRLEFSRSTGEPLVLGVSVSPLQSRTGEEYDMVMVLRDETGPVKEIAA